MSDNPLVSLMYVPSHNISMQLVDCSRQQSWQTATCLAPENPENVWVDSTTSYIVKYRQHIAFDTIGGYIL